MEQNPVVRPSRPAASLKEGLVLTGAYAGAGRMWSVLLCLRTEKGEDCLSRKAALATVFKPGQPVERDWQCLDGFEHFGRLIASLRLRHGAPIHAAVENAAA